VGMVAVMFEMKNVSVIFLVISQNGIPEANTSHS